MKIESTIINFLIKSSAFLVLITTVYVNQASAAEIYFVSSGSQLDGDAINDIRIGSGESLTFDVYANITGYTSPYANAKSISLDVSFFYDSAEYTFPLNNNGLEVFSFDLSGAVTQRVLSIKGTTVNPGIGAHDGIVDFGIELKNLSFFDANNQYLGNDTANNFDAPELTNTLVKDGNKIGFLNFNQVVELQVSEPTTFALLTLSLIGIAISRARYLGSK